MSIQLAKQYYEYMNFRANEENLKHELSIEFYQVGLNEGCPFFFGVYHNGKNINSHMSGMSLSFFFGSEVTEH